MKSAGEVRSPRIVTPVGVGDDGGVSSRRHRPRGQRFRRRRRAATFRIAPRTVTTVIAGTLTLGLSVGMLLVTPPYAIQRPGPTLDTLGDIDEVPLIAVEDAESYPAQGELRLTTVSVIGGPGYPATAGDVLRSWLDSGHTVLPREALFDESETREDVSQRSAAAMTSSQTNATVAALEYLGYDVPTRLVVNSVAQDGAAAGVIEPEDVIVDISTPQAGEVELSNFADLAGALAVTPPGESVEVGVERGDQEERLELETGDDGEGGSLLGVLIAPDIDVPIAIDFAIENVGGPSAGLMLSLGIVDLLSPGDLTGGEHVAGTGTMSLDGQIGTIGGIRQKLVGAHRDGARWFLAPAGNCDETIGYEPDGLRVIPVESLAGAVEIVEAIGAGDTETLPTCPGA